MDHIIVNPDTQINILFWLIREEINIDRVENKWRLKE
jgi:hypothetical protein